METYLGFLSEFCLAPLTRDCEPPEDRGVAISGGVGRLLVPCPQDVHSFFFLSLFIFGYTGSLLVHAGVL